jgi:putative DNA primase/helicase
MSDGDVREERADDDDLAEVDLAAAGVNLEALDGLVERAKTDAGAPFVPAVLAAASALRAADLAAYVRLREALKAVIPIGAWEKALDGFVRERARAKAQAAREAQRPTDEFMPAFPHHDTGNAERLIARHGEELRFYAERDEWLAWARTHWTLDKAASALFRTKSIAHEMEQEVQAHVEAAGASLDPEVLGRLWRGPEHAYSGAGRATMLQLARAEPRISVLASDLDANPWAINVQNGTVDVRTGKLHRHNPKHLITRVCPVVYDPEADLAATCPRFLRFLEEAIPDAPTRDFLQCWAGSTLTGSVRDHVFVVLYGPEGRNGKGTFVETLLHVLGGYARAINPDMLMMRDTEQHETELADLLGVRLAIASETNMGRRLNEARVKNLTGGDTISARYMRKDKFTFRPSHKLALQTNKLPSVDGMDSALARRMRIVPWTVSFAGREDTSLPETLRAEANGVFLWLLEGARLWFARGLGMPAAVQDANRQYREANDEVEDFLAECCSLEPTACCAAREAYTRFAEWEKKAERRPPSHKAFAQLMAAKGRVSRKSHGVMVYDGLRVLPWHEIERRSRDAVEQGVPAPTRAAANGSDAWEEGRE